MGKVNPRPWPPERFPTAREWLDWFESNDEAVRLWIAQKAVDAMYDAHTCALNHAQDGQNRPQKLAEGVVSTPSTPRIYRALQGLRTERL